MILLPISSSFLVELQHLAEYDVAKVQGIEDAVNIDLHLHHLYCLLLDVGHPSSPYSNLDP